MISAIQRRLAARQDNQGGFTLIELMVVVMIIAILVGIAIPAFLGARKRAQDTASKSNLRNALGTAQTIYTDTQAFLATAAMVTELTNDEPSLEFVDGSAATGVSDTAKKISVNTSGTGLDTIILASKSASGKCFFLRHINTPGTGGGSQMVSTSGATPACAAVSAPATGWLPL